MRLYAIVVDTYEPSNPFPIVSHTFRGKTPAEAQGYVRAHQRSDQFFRECATGLFAGKVRCSNRVRSQGWVDV